MIGTSKNIFGFDPRSVPGCVVWLDAADSNTLTLSGANITAWRDKSVLGNNVTSISATPPTFSSVDSSVNFTAASCNFLRGNLSDTYSNNATVFAVASVTPTPELSAGVVTTFAGNGTGSYVNNTGTNATFQYPAGVTVDGSETVYVIDSWNHRIRRITPLGVVSLLAGSGTPAFADGTGAGASFAYPGTGVTDNAGNLYVVDGNNRRIRRIVISTGVVTTLAGNGTASSVNGTGGSATFNAPAGIAISLDRTRLFVTELFGNRVRQIVISTAVVTTLAGSGTGASTDGTGTAAAFFNPLPIAADPFGNLYVGDSGSHRIRKINIASTIVTTFAGSSLGTNNGTGTTAQFNYPSGLTTDENGNVYVAEADTPRIRKITPGAVVTTFAGSGTATSVDGTGTNATFSKPRQLFYNPDGIIYVADEVGHRIRKMNTKTVNLTFPQVSSLGSNAVTENNLMGQSFEIQGVTQNLLTFVENSTNPTGLGSNIQTYLSNTLLNKKLILANTSTYSGTTFGITSILNGATQTFTSRTGTLATNSSNVSTYNKYAIGGMLNVTATVPTSFNGKVFEYLVFNNALTTSQRLQIEGYLANKWGLAQYLSISPLAIPGCQLWLDGADQSSMTFSGSNITQWNDKSGNGYHATLESGKTGAIFSTALNAVNFTTSNTSYQTSYTAAPTNETMFIVFNNASPSVYNAILVGSQLGGRAFGAGYSGVGGVQTVNVVGNLKNGAAWLARTSSGSYIPGTTAISTSQFTSSNNTISINGGTDAIQALAPAFTAGTTTFLGIDKRTTIYYYIGHVMEMIFYNSILSISQRTQIEEYLSKKWKITNLYVELSSNNPYYSIRPHLRSFQPSDIAGCQLWLDAADQSSMTLSGSNVTQWMDKSGNGYVMTNNQGTTTVETASLNSLTTVYTPSGTNTRITNFVGRTKCTIFLVANAATSKYLLALNGGVLYTGNDSLLYFQPPTGNYLDIIDSVGLATPVVSNNSWFILCIGYDNATNSTANPYTINGTTRSTAITPRGTPGILTDQNITSTLYINSVNGTNSYDSVYTAEILYYNDTLTTSQRQQVEGYLAHKWGLTANLFSPLSIPGCQLWLDGADSSTVTGTSAVTQWRDKSGNGRNTTTTGTVSYANSGMSITTSSSYLTGSFGTPDYTGSTVTCFIVGSMSSLSGSVARFLSLGKVGTQDWDNLASITLGRGDGLLLRPYRTVPTQSPPSIPAYDTRFLATWGQTSSSLFNSINGGALSTASLSGAFAINAYRIGNDLLSDDVNEQFNGVINEIVVYFSELTISQRQRIEGYLSQKWGLGVSSYNPSTHPFYKFPPSSVPFSPSSISGLSVWFDAADMSTITGSSTVTAWRDKSSNRWNATTLIGTAPTNTSVAGNNAISFPSASTLTVSNVTFSSVQSRAIFVVYRVVTSGSYISWFSTQASGINNQGGHNNLVLPTGGGGPYVQSYAVGGAVRGMGADPAVSTIGTTALGVMIHSAVSTSSNVVTLNGTSYALTTNTLASGYGSGTVTYYIGNAYPQAYILCEYILYQKEFTVTERQQVEGYLAQKWGITSSLPSTHPFKKLPIPPVKIPILETALSYLPLDTNSRDIGTDPQVITTNGTVTYTTIAGRQCAYFNNSLNNYISLPYRNKNSFTICFWLSPFNTTFYTAVSITLVTSGVAQSADSPGLQADITGTSTTVVTRMPNRWTNSHPATSLGVGNWTHYAVTVNQVTFVSQLYINGLFSSTRTGTGTGISVRNTFFIGRSGDISRAYNGYVTKFVHFDRVLSAAEVAEVYVS